MADIQEQLQDIVDKVNEFIGSLNLYENIALGVSGLGVVLIITGIVFLFV